jgi:hypothetical protein
MLVSSVTWAFRARSLPSTTAFENNVIESMAMIVPEKVEAPPKVAELPTTQNTFFACAPLIRIISLFAAVTSVLPDFNMKDALTSPPPSRVRGPVKESVPAEYTPAVSVVPPNSLAIPAVSARPDASPYAVTRSSFAP